MNPVKFCILREKWRRYFDEGQRDVFEDNPRLMERSSDKSSEHAQLVNPIVQTIDSQDSRCSSTSSEMVVTSSDIMAEGTSAVDDDLEQMPNTPNIELAQEIDQNVAYTEEHAQGSEPNLAIPDPEPLEQLHSDLERKPQFLEPTHTQLCVDFNKHKRAQIKTMFLQSNEFTLVVNPKTKYIFKKTVLPTVTVYNGIKKNIRIGKKQLSRKIKRILENIKLQRMIERESQTRLQPPVEHVVEQVEVVPAIPPQHFEEPNEEQDQYEDNNYEDDYQEAMFDFADIVHEAGAWPQLGTNDIKMIILVSVGLFLRAIKGDIVEELLNHVSYVVFILFMFVFLFLLCMCKIYTYFMSEGYEDFEGYDVNDLPFELANIGREVDALERMIEGMRVAPEPEQLVEPRLAPDAQPTPSSSNTDEE